MNDKRYIEIDKYESEFRKLIETKFNIKLEGMFSSSCSEMNGPINFKARISTKNRNLLGTRYFYSSNKKVIHFTSLPVLFSIINENALRLYNLHNSNDENEYSYAVDKLKDIYKIQGIDNEKIKGSINITKEYSFIFSSTSHEAIKKKSFWQNYGDKGKGVAIEFEIINPVEEWEYFYFSKVHYDKLSDFNTLTKEWEKIQVKNRHVFYGIDLNQFLSLHKSHDWSEEDEIRILTLYPDLHSIPFKGQIYQDFKPAKPHSKIKYFKLPLCDKNGNFIEKGLNDRKEIFWSIIPRIRISDIYWGPDFPIQGKDLYNFQNKLKYYIYEKMKCRIGSLPKNIEKIE
ncbi:DUF2971 domain-containing protein [Draconibacterium sediminis]|uniref:DUF2971 domain-containing protein n=1 Tax=Draconibacterium sediminis TaxID=1544798 RepID=A0A0D8JBA5_9BACT|nr:DUF2971 domain-containing protein [Draconibacterium sediminis]KJF43098.1 hypothetical protein LH29_17115 [Draconibacterium sediminis]